jgi:hypothetical protein
MTVRLFINLEALRSKLDETEIAELDRSMNKKISMGVNVRGRYFECGRRGDYHADLGTSIAFATLPEDLDGIVKRISIHDEFTANPPRHRGLYEHGTASAELELTECTMGSDYSEEVIRRYKLELVAESDDAQKMLDDARDLYFGIKENTMEPKRFYGYKPTPRTEQPETVATVAEAERTEPAAEEVGVGTERSDENDQ